MSAERISSFSQAGITTSVYNCRNVFGTMFHFETRKICILLTRFLFGTDDILPMYDISSLVTSNKSIVMDTKDVSYYFITLPNQSIQCCLCGECFKIRSKGLFENHMIIHHHKISKTIPDLKIKMERKKHEEEEKENRKMELKRVKMKERLVWNDRKFVWNHFIQDAVNNCWICQHCGKVYNGDRPNRQHLLSHHADKLDLKILGKFTDVQKCSHCDKVFQFPAQRKRHESNHTKEKACFTCGKLFAETCHLRTHELVHSGKKPHECNTCGSKFALNSQLKSHTRVHTGETPFQCYKCGKSFKFQSSRDNHKCIC